MPKSEILGEGSYGCIIEKPIKCTTKPKKITKDKILNKQIVGKIYSDKQDFDDELTLSKKVAKIDPKGKSLLPTYEACETNIDEIKKASQWEDCEIIADNTEQKKFYQIIMPYGGVRIDHYFMNTTRTINLKNFLEIMKPLFDGLILLDSKKNCHQDIKNGNILVTPQNKAIMIDYGLMKRYSDIYVESNVSRLRYTYFPYPLEFKIFYYTVYGYCGTNCEQDIISNIEIAREIQKDEYYRYFPKEETLKRINRLKKIFEELQRKNKLLQFVNKNCDKIDVYSLGLVFMQNIKNIKYSDKYTDIIQNFIKSLIHPDVRKRSNSKKTYIEYSNLIKKIVE